MKAAVPTEKTYFFDFNGISGGFPHCANVFRWKQALFKLSMWQAKNIEIHTQLSNITPRDGRSPFFLTKI